MVWLAKIQDLSHIVDDNLSQITFSQEYKEKLRERTGKVHRTARRRAWIPALAAVVICVCAWAVVPWFSSSQPSVMLTASNGEGADEAAAEAGVSPQPREANIVTEGGMVQEESSSAVSSGKEEGQPPTEDSKAEEPSVQEAQLPEEIPQNSDGTETQASSVAKPEIFEEGASYAPNTVLQMVPGTVAAGGQDADRQTYLSLSEALFQSVVQDGQNTAFSPAGLEEISQMLRGDEETAFPSLWDGIQAEAGIWYDPDGGVVWKDSFQNAAGTRLNAINAVSRKDSTSGEAQGLGGLLARFCEEGAGQVFAAGTVSVKTGGDLLQTSPDSEIISDQTESRFLEFSAVKIGSGETQGFYVEDPEGKYRFAALIPDVPLSEYVKEEDAFVRFLSLVLEGGQQKINGKLPVFTASGTVLISELADPSVSEDISSSVSSLLSRAVQSGEAKLWDIGLSASFSVDENAGFFTDPVRADQQELILDRPFLYLVVEVQTGLPVAMGAVENP